jgi:anaerobic ribonucleoside-triphosphate reductase activating protein
MQCENITSLGPYSRYGIWFHGCDKHCKGCIYREKSTTAFETVEVDALVEAVTACEGIEGVTVSGGEPFLQPEGLLCLLKRLREHGLGVIVYTGRRLEEISADERLRECLEYVDLLIDGEYVEELDFNNSLVGSENQTVHFLTDRYVEFSSLYGERGHRRSEVRISDSEICTVGIPTKEQQLIMEAVFGWRKE